MCVCVCVYPQIATPSSFKENIGGKEGGKRRTEGQITNMMLVEGAQCQAQWLCLLWGKQCRTL